MAFQGPGRPGPLCGLFGRQGPVILSSPHVTRCATEPLISGQRLSHAVCSNNTLTDNHNDIISIRIILSINRINILMMIKKDVFSKEQIS